MQKNFWNIYWQLVLTNLFLQLDEEPELSVVLGFRLKNKISQGWLNMRKFLVWWIDTRAVLNIFSDLLSEQIPCDAIRPLCELAALKRNNLSVFKRHTKNHHGEFTCKIKREALRKVRPADDAILFLLEYQFFTVQTRETGSSTQADKFWALSFS